MPVPGDGRYEWQGFLQGEQLPWRYNPKEGWFATANEMNLPADYPAETQPISFEWSDPTRITRIKAVLESTAHVSLADSMALQNDNHDPLAGSLIAQLSALSSKDLLVSRSLDLLRELGSERIRGQYRRGHLPGRWASNYLSPMTVRRVTPYSVHELFADGSLAAVIDYLAHPDDRSGPDPPAARDALLVDSLGAAVEHLKTQFGPDISALALGKLHQLRFRPAIAALADPALETSCPCSHWSSGARAIRRMRRPSTRHSSRSWQGHPCESFWTSETGTAR